MLFRSTLRSELKWQDAIAYILVQCLAAFAGVAIAHGMFELPVFFASQHARTGLSQWMSEVVATFGLLMVILGCAAHRASAVPYAVGAYIAGAYWFTSSTSFANPAVTLARAATDTFADIRPDDVPAFIVAQLAGALLALLVMRWLLANRKA